MCCELNPDQRPAFSTLTGWFDRLMITACDHHQPPSDLKLLIENFHGESSSNCNTPDTNEKLPPKFPPSIKVDTTEVDSPTKEKVEVTGVISKTVSPHLAKDFTPDGDRIRDSWRAKRKQKLRENRCRPNTIDTQPETVKAINKKVDNTL